MLSPTTCRVVRERLTEERTPKLRLKSGVGVGGLQSKGTEEGKNLVHAGNCSIPSCARACVRSLTEGAAQRPAGTGHSVSDE